mmetsp:Transcript_18100/g.31245  ORF Transcript_18100/g.31245 Transcript_18100/m.31245 type:complete len:217 (-) Transcript_18100:625-1275(-)
MAFLLFSSSDQRVYPSSRDDFLELKRDFDDGAPSFPHESDGDIFSGDSRGHHLQRKLLRVLVYLWILTFRCGNCSCHPRAHASGHSLYLPLFCCRIVHRRCIRDWGRDLLYNRPRRDEEGQGFYPKRAGDILERLPGRVLLNHRLHSHSNLHPYRRYFHTSHVARLAYPDWQRGVCPDIMHCTVRLFGQRLPGRPLRPGRGLQYCCLDRLGVDHLR